VTLQDRVRDGLIMLAVAALSFGLLVYVGWGEGKRTYPHFQVEKMAAQGELVQAAMETYLRAGLPLRQFPGFRSIAEPIRSSDPTIAAIAVQDRMGQAIFAAGDATVPHLPGGTETPRFTVRDDGVWLQVAVPLRNRFETVGELSVTMPRAAIAAVTDAQLPVLATAEAMLALLFGLFALWIAPKSRSSRFPWIGSGYVVCFGLAAAAVIASLVLLYAEGAQSKARALADSLGHRIRPVIAYGLVLEDVDGLDRTLVHYRQLNPDIEAVGITHGGRVIVHSDPAQVGKPWRSDPSAFEYVVPVAATAAAPAASDVRVAVALPAGVVWHAVAQSVKNFAALFVATALIAALFLGVARALEGGRTGRKPEQLILIKPIFFIAVFCENLSAGFLPQLLRGAALEAGLGNKATSLAFTAYFVAFLLALLPASAWAERVGPRRVVITGALVAALASWLPVLTLDFDVLVAARALAGIGQGLLFTGMQAAVLLYAPAGQRTQAAAVIVFGFNGGMIAGAAIGSLLVQDVAALGVFAIGAVSAMLVAVYAAFAIPAGSTHAAAAVRFTQLLRDIPRACASLDFLRGLLLIGAPAKAVLTGAVGFAMPLLLAGMGWPPEDIGQIIMVYATGVLLSGGFAARLVDRTGRSAPVLMLGGLGAAVALGCIGLIGLWPAAGIVQAALVVGGTLLLGLSHGCINAPVITYIAGTSAADRLGPNGATALYRVVERAGHVLGPMLAAQLLLLSGGGAQAFLWLSGGLLVLLLLFLLPVGRRVA